MNQENLFAYGTLMCPDILEAVLWKKRSGISALLSGYGRFRVSGEHYPGIIPVAGAVVPGVLFPGISPEGLRRLDIFEGQIYTRTTVYVLAPDFGVYAAFAYVVRPEYRSYLTSEPWNVGYLTTERRQSFVSQYAGFGRMKCGE